MTKELAAFHAKRYGPPSEFGYEDLVPLFKAEKWDPEALVKFFKDNGARFIMPVACHHDNFDMYDSFHPLELGGYGAEARHAEGVEGCGLQTRPEVWRLDPPLLVATLFQYRTTIPDAGLAGGEAVQYGV
jgi:hypothetical protein